MGNIITYLQENGEKNFAQLPFSEVDSLILSEAAYFDFSASPFCNPYPEISLGGWLKECQTPGIQKGSLTAVSDRALMDQLKQGGRIGDLCPCSHVSESDRQNEIQFSAITFRLAEDIWYIAFRGTDNSVIGWKEDMALYYLPAIPAQQAAVNYAIQIMERLPGRFYLGGHSKGGNLSVYCATHLPDHLQERLITVYDHDGPGFPQRFYEKEGYQAVGHKIHKTLPRSAVIGLLLENGVGYHVVDSKADALLQHDPFSWEVEGVSFVTLPEVDDFALHVDLALTQWTEGMEPETIKKVVDLVFDLIFSTGIEAFAEMKSDPVGHIRTILKNLAETEKEEKKMLLSAISGLISATTEEARELLDKELDRKLTQIRQELPERLEAPGLLKKLGRGEMDER